MNKKCPHLNCLVYHADGVCNCNMSRYCPQCKSDTDNNVAIKPSTVIEQDWELKYEKFIIKTYLK